MAGAGFDLFGGLAQAGATIMLAHEEMKTADPILKAANLTEKYTLKLVDDWLEFLTSSNTKHHLGNWGKDSYYRRSSKNPEAAENRLMYNYNTADFWFATPEARAGCVDVYPELLRAVEEYKVKLQEYLSKDGVALEKFVRWLKDPFGTNPFEHDSVDGKARVEELVGINQAIKRFTRVIEEQNHEDKHAYE